MSTDQTQDINGQELFRIVSLYGAPTYVKDASAKELCGEGLPQALYADPLRRLYPLHSAAATWASAAFLLEKAGEAERADLWDRIVKSASYFGVADDVASLREKIAASACTNDEALPDDMFALVGTDEEGNKQRKYPIRNIKEARLAAQFIVEHRDELPLPVCRKFAECVLRKAAAYGADIRPQLLALEKMAGNGVSDAKSVAAAIRVRALSLGIARDGNPVCENLEKLACEIESHPQHTLHYGFLVNFADTIDAFDRQHGLHRQYKDGLPRPEDIAFGVTKQAVAEVTQDFVVNRMTGSVYKRAELDRIHLHDISECLGQEIANAVSAGGALLDTEKLAMVLPTLPRGDAEIFDSLAAEAGVAPVTTTKKTAGISRNQPAKPATIRPGGLWAQWKASSAT